MALTSLQPGRRRALVCSGTTPPPTCNLTLERPSGSILLISTLGDAWQMTRKTGFGAAPLTAKQRSCNSPAAIPNVTANRPSCSSAYVCILGGSLSTASVSIGAS
jgi:hypothetical protein